MTSAPEGNWVGVHGTAGYDLAAWNGASDLLSMTDTAVSLVQGSRYVWAAQTEDPRALRAPQGSEREAATWYDPARIELQMQLSSAYKGDIHLYAVDWDSTARRELVTVDGQTAELSSSFHEGAWVTFPIEVAAGATVTITVDRSAGSNAVLSGIFLE